MENSRKRNRDVISEGGDDEAFGHGLQRHNEGKVAAQKRNAGLPSRYQGFIVEARRYKISRTNPWKGMTSEEAIKFKDPGATVEVAERIHGNEPDNKQQVSENLMVSKCSENVRLEQFTVGDVVWARTDRRDGRIAWPAKVIDPEKDAPESVQSVWVPGRLCVKFFRRKRSSDCEYAWVKDEMMLPFLEGEKELAAEGEKLLEKGHKAALDELLEAVDEAIEAHFSSQCSFLLDHERHKEGETACNSCGQKFPASKLIQSVKVKQLANSSRNNMLICPRCCKLYKFNQYCGICKEVCKGSTLKRSWVQCGVCKIWVHGDCDAINTDQPEYLVEYSCPQCRLKQPALVTTMKCKINEPFTVPERITVVCNGKEAEYMTNSHLILCKCSECEKVPLKLGLKARGLGFFISEGKTPIKTRERELIGWLLEPYNPIYETWTAERCAICFGFEDWPHDKVIICNGCNIGVHQSCYGATESVDNWACRVCQRAEIGIRPQYCCLCPVMGGALKPTTTREFWVHVTCAWLTDEVKFVNEETKEPVQNILKINPASFRKSCVICENTHGSCIKCLECDTFYHPVCALRKGYHMELLFWKVGGKKLYRCISYCASHKVPNPTVGLIFTDQDCIFTPNQNETAAVTHLKDSIDESSISEGGNNFKEFELSEMEEQSASKCCVYNTLKMKSGISAILQKPVGYSHHKREVIDRLNKREETAPRQHSSNRERLLQSQKNEKKRFCFGKSGLHGFGLFSLEHIRGGDMLLEYRGEIIRHSVANVREKIYQSKGKHSTYFFAINQETVIDATMSGNLARLINHSCAPNCFSRILAVDGVETRIALFAKRDIEAREEITYDYRLSKDGIKERCICGAATCRKVMNDFS